MSEQSRIKFKQAGKEREARSGRLTTHTGLFLTLHDETKRTDSCRGTRGSRQAKYRSQPPSLLELSSLTPHPQEFKMQNVDALLYFALCATAAPSSQLFIDTNCFCSRGKSTARGYAHALGGRRLDWVRVQQTEDKEKKTHKCKSAVR